MNMRYYYFWSLMRKTNRASSLSTSYMILCKSPLFMYCKMNVMMMYRSLLKDMKKSMVHFRLSWHFMIEWKRIYYESNVTMNVSVLIYGESRIIPMVSIQYFKEIIDKKLPLCSVNCFKMFSLIRPTMTMIPMNYIRQLFTDDKSKLNFLQTFEN